MPDTCGGLWVLHARSPPVLGRCKWRYYRPRLGDYACLPDWTFPAIDLEAGGTTCSIARPDTGSTRSERIWPSPRHTLLGLSVRRGTGWRWSRSGMPASVWKNRDAYAMSCFASVAHDFRTPLTVVSSALAKACDGDDGAADALIATRRVERMMNDLVGRGADRERRTCAPTRGSRPCRCGGGCALGARQPARGVVMSQQVSPNCRWSMPIRCCCAISSSTCWTTQPAMRVRLSL